jgi:recombination protein RecA
MSEYEEMKMVMEELVAPRAVVVDKSSRTGVPSLDLALGLALPAGATEIFGVPGAGKSSLGYEIIATAQADGFIVALAATEYIDLLRMDVIGCQRDTLLIIKGDGPHVMQGSLDFLESCRRDNVRCMLVVDSGTGIRPYVDEFDNASVMMERFLMEALGALPLRSGIVVINQVRQKKSIGKERMFTGDVDSTSRKLVEMFSARLKLNRSQVDEYSYDLLVDIVANEGGPPASILRLPFWKKTGIDTMKDLVRCGVACGALSKAGEWYHFRSVNLGQGETEAAHALSKNPDWAHWVLDSVMRGGPK